MFQLTFCVKVNCGGEGSLLFLGAGTRILVLLAVSYGSTEVTGYVLRLIEMAPPCIKHASVKTHNSTELLYF